MYNPGYKQSINIRVSKRATHQLLSRIFGIFLHEILDYQNVSLVYSNVNSNDSEVSKLFHQLLEIASGENLIDLEVWMYPNFHAIPYYNVYEAGTVTYPGRFGWYTEANFVTDPNVFVEDLHYSLFLYPDRMYYRKYVIDKIILDELERKFGFQKIELSYECQNYNKTCATIFAPDYEETSFLSKHVEEFNLYLQIIWIDDKHFKNTLDYLHNKYKSQNIRKQNKRYLFLSWSPSAIIDDKIDYVQLTLPPCERFKSAAETTCKYEMTPILKYYERKFQNYKLAFNALTLFEIERENLRQILIESNLAKMNNPKMSVSEIYNVVACNYLKNYPNEYLNWLKTSEKSSLFIGGIFPLTGNGKLYGNLIPFVRSATEAINNNSSVLSNFRLSVSYNDGQCKADTVMKAFIHYFNLATPIIGVLGPACSETVEPIAGVSKHTRMTVISYSAEGALFTDRNTYPYFFRTIGSNRQYEQVYFDLFKHFEWRQIAALTEDGQKYTEYISHMDTLLKQQGVDLILNKKFPKDVTSTEMNRLLQEFKNKNARIIIADIYNDNARSIMCEAYNLQMTARHGYVWFLPAWISKVWNGDSSSITIDNMNTTCTKEELSEAVNGHFSLTHSAFAPSDSIMIENKTVHEWKENYLKRGGEAHFSNYAAFAYDAVWVYALAADKLLHENPSAIYDLRSPDVIKRLSEIISDTDFNGLSGRIRFDEGGSRIDNVDILQWINGKFNHVGTFTPTIDEKSYKIIGGELALNESNINWLSGERPKDGAYQCSMATLAEFLQTTCENVNYIVIILSLVVALCVLSTGSFIFWKYRYHAKLKQSAKVMKNFGIDLLSPNAKTYNTLDKWEISKDKVVINRRLGEGAFGTVYGGEAQLDDQGWTAVAVKTLKVGASTEDRLDFLCEAEAMKRFDHKNIIKLIGVCLQSEPMYTIMEFMLYGDLRNFLLARRNLVDGKITDESDISPKRLSMYALDVARGLSYLADEKYVHRDIACRNCLVNTQRVVKIGDFGMARPTFESDYYRFNRKGMLPVRWMAPESLGLGLFTPASDVWSFAVLLYEIITFGSFPYQGLSNKQALEAIKQGQILTIPRGVKPHLEGLMKACWSLDYKKRPSASEIVEYISSNPRLLTPCLDVPLSSVQMAESDSDQWELLPGLRKRISTQPKIDILPSKTSNLNDFDEKSHSNGNINEIKTNKPINGMIPIPSTSIIIHNSDDKIIDNVIGNSIEENNLNGYSVMSPLLKMEPEITNSNSSLKRYVPMYNIGKKPKIYNSNCNNNNTNNNNNINSSNNSSPINKRSIDKGNKLFINEIELLEMRS
ncbi:atrial natriuretic peptide receptor 2-like isoform X2 [Condylostylus longicornis]|nr:atrial natriuretic peptide receptor 2-like isoform X2 [Condylostylus longicornis]XP_055386457.1 atrial natriuretic peptide receptor 2-like isoform X2 [Condylostylus longicornis]